jgi:hypothetical protein
MRKGKPGVKLMKDVNVLTIRRMLPVAVTLYCRATLEDVAVQE